MFYIHQTSCISPQQTFGEVDIIALHPPKEYQLKVIEPAYTGIPTGVLRRMSKAVRMGMGAALPLLQEIGHASGIIIGTANAGMEDCFHFLKQMIEYDEGLLTPGSFVQSTPNALAAQLAMLSHNNSYNITHVHLGLAFENAVTDVAMLLKEQPGKQYLLGAVDDISSYNYALNVLAGWYRKEDMPEDWYNEANTSSIPGEGAAMFLVNAAKENALAKVIAVQTVHTTDPAVVQVQLAAFLHSHGGIGIDAMLSGETGDGRLLPFYTACESLLPETAAVLRYKHICGEYPTATAFALWLACYILKNKVVPEHMIKRSPVDKTYRNLLLYNNHKGDQHSFMLVANPVE